MTETNLISLRIPIPKENEHTIQFYTETHVNNVAKALCSKIEKKGSHYLLEWRGVTDETTTEIIRAINDIRDLYNVEVDWVIAKELPDVVTTTLSVIA